MELDKTIVAGDLKRNVADKVHFVIGTEGPLQGRRIELGKEPIIFGRSPAAQIQINDPTASSQHCRMSVFMGSAMIEDLGSSNGTFVNAQRVSEPTVVASGSVIQIGDSMLKVELLSQEEVQQEEWHQGDLKKAANYVRSLLPAPLKEGLVTTSWRFIPSDALGGDAFGYHWIDERRFAIYLVDVSGHGTAPSLHSVSVINLLRKQSLPQVDFTKPDEVLKALNTNFPMEDHANMYFTVWYGVFDTETRKLDFASGGHPPALLVTHGEGKSLQTPNLAVGLMAGVPFQSASVEVPPASRLFIYSDGAYEVVTEDGEEWRVGAFLEMLAGCPEDGKEPQWVESSVRKVMAPDKFDDDFSVLVARLP